MCLFNVSLVLFKFKRLGVFKVFKKSAGLSGAVMVDVLHA